MTTSAMRVLDGGRTVLAEHAMSAPAIALPASASVWDAWATMCGAGVRHMVVCDIDGRCVGVVDDRTVLAQWPAGPAVLRDRPVLELLAATFPFAAPDAPLRAVAASMVVNVVEAVPIVDPDGHPIGIITSADVVAAVARFGLAPRAG